MKVGADGSKLPAAEQGPMAVLDQARELGLDGVFFRTVLDLSPNLDGGFLKEVRAHADELGLYMHLGLAKVNPYAAPENPKVRELGNGDVRLGMERMIRACEAIGCRELWTAMASYKPQYPGYFCFDRFRTDVSWEDQLIATEKYLKLLAPFVRDLGVHLDLETHEEITTPELVRLVEAVGDDVLGITFDTANVFTRGEAPLATARRVAPYTRLTHIRDVVLFFTPSGLGRCIAPCGEGVIDWSSLLAILAEHTPDLHLSIESPTKSWAEMPIPLYDPVWQEAHPDLAIPEVVELVRLTRYYEDRAARGEVPAADDFRQTPLNLEERLRFVSASADFLRQTLSSPSKAMEPTTKESL